MNIVKAVMCYYRLNGDALKPMRRQGDLPQPKRAEAENKVKVNTEHWMLSRSLSATLNGDREGGRLG